MNNRRSGRAPKPSRRLLESGNSIAVIEDNGPSPDYDMDESMNDDQLNNTMDVDDAASKPEDTAKPAWVAKREDQKRRSAMYKEKHDRVREQERQQAKMEGISLWRFQENQREEGRRREALRLQEEAVTSGILGRTRGHRILDPPARQRIQTPGFPGMVPSEPPKPIGTHVKVEKASEHQKGAGRDHRKHDKNIKKFVPSMHKYKINRLSTLREKKAHDRKRDKLAAALAERDVADLAIAMFDRLILCDSVNVTYRGERVAPDVGIWNMFGGQPEWYQPLPAVDAKILDLFPLGHPLPCFTEQRVTYELTNRKYRGQFAESLGMSVRRLVACFNRSGGPKLGAMPCGPPIKELAGYEYSIQKGGYREPFTSQIQSIKENNYLVAMKVQALRKKKAVDENNVMAQRSTTRLPVLSIRQEALRRQPFLRERAFRNIVKIQELREEHAAKNIDTDMDGDDNAVDTSNSFIKRVTFGKGIKLKPIQWKGEITFKQMAAMDAEVKAIKGDAKPVRSEPDTYNEDGDPIRCICGGVELDDDYDGKWIRCDECEVWQHNVCVGASLDDEVLEDMEYFCEECRPEDHEEYFEALERGEEIWDARIHKNNEEEKRKRAERRKKRKSKGDVDVLMDNMVSIKIQGGT